MTQKKPQNLTQYTYEYIRKKILTCTIFPGALIKEKEILDEIQISKTPFREAILRLESENLVEIRPRLGMFAKMITEQDVVEVYSVRKTIEPYAVIDALNMIDLSRMLELNKDWETVSMSSEYSQMDICDKDLMFHDFLVQCTRNSHLYKMFHPILQEALRISTFNAVVKNTSDDFAITAVHHEKIINAILEEDRESIIKSYNLHLNYFMSSAVSSIRKYNSSHPF